MKEVAPKSEDQITLDVKQATVNLELAIQELRSLVVEPVVVAFGPHMSLELQPADHDERITIMRAGWGSTCVNYTSESLILDVVADEKAEVEFVHTMSIPLDELCGPEEDKPELNSNKSVTVIVPVHATSDDGDSPSGAAIVVNAGFIKRLQEAKLMINRSGGIQKIISSDAPTWLPVGIDEEMTFNNPELVFTDDRFWFVDSPKHASFNVESASLSINDLMITFNDAENHQIVVLGDDDFKDHVNVQGLLIDLLINLNDLERAYVDAASNYQSKLASLQGFDDELHAFVEVRDKLQAHQEFAGYLPETYFSGGELDPVGVAVSDAPQS